MLYEKKYAYVTLFARFSNAADTDNVKLKKFNAFTLNSNSENNISCVFKVSYLNICFMLNKEIIIFLYEIKSSS